MGDGGVDQVTRVIDKYEYVASVEILPNVGRLVQENLDFLGYNLDIRLRLRNGLDGT